MGSGGLGPALACNFLQKHKSALLRAARFFQAFLNKFKSSGAIISGA
jgi:hypothetical protein